MAQLTPRHMTHNPFGAARPGLPAHRSPPSRVAADGRFLSLEGRPFRIRGATYGTFRPDAEGVPFPPTATVRADFAMMAAAGLNVVRTYTLPTADVLELAEEAGLRLLVGLDYPDWRFESSAGQRARRRVRDAGLRAVEDAMLRLGGRPSVLALAVGNEIPSDIVRFHGVLGVQDTLIRLVEEVHAADQGMLATYCNFPTTEYLEVEGQDFACFNVFLETPDAFAAYVRRLHTVANGVPLLLSEVGLASEVHGEHMQECALEWQLRLADELGCAGAVVFSWTDEWTVAGVDVEGWGFGLTTRERCPKPGLGAVQRWAALEIQDWRPGWPRISIVVCAYNAAPTIESCLSSLERCSYPELELILCDDGSTDGTAMLAARHGCKVLRLPHQGLAKARNVGLQAATGLVVAYLDADAMCHPEWPFHLALSMEAPGVGAAGGPNLMVEGASWVERAVSSSPGCPVEVLMSDDRAEHVPGCNMAFHRRVLEDLGGFDPICRTAGDDVDICWRALDAGYVIAFAPAAQVRHHRRDTVSAYLKQQVGYGRAERLISGRHRHRFNRLGQARWAGFIYGGLTLLPRLLRPVIYHGPAGTAPFQGVVDRRPVHLLAWCQALIPPLAPVALAGLALASLSRWALLVSALAVGLLAALAAAVALAVRPPRGTPHPFAFRLLVACLHVLQPLARAWGRLTGQAAAARASAPAPWTGDRGRWLADLERGLRARGCAVRSPPPHRDWDLEVRVGPLLACRLGTAVAWEWEPRCRLRWRPRPLAFAAAAVAAFLILRAPGAGLALMVALALAAGVELVFGQRRVHAALSESLAGLRTSAEAGLAQGR